MTDWRVSMADHADALAHTTCETSQRPWPVDEATGFPLPVYALDKAPGVYTRSGQPYHADPDLHHFFFPRALYNGREAALGGQVVRLTRVQKVRRYHHTELHKNLGPPPPLTDPTDQFNIGVLALSDYLPRQAVDPRTDAMEVVRLDSRQHNKIRERTYRDFDVQYHSVIGKFFLRVMTTRHIHSLDPNVPEEFLHTKISKRRYDLARYILHSVAEDAVMPINAVYARGVHDELIPPNAPSPFRIVTFYAKKTKVEEGIASAVREALSEAA